MSVPNLRRILRICTTLVFASNWWFPIPTTTRSTRVRSRKKALPPWCERYLGQARSSPIIDFRKCEMLWISREWAKGMLFQNKHKKRSFYRCFTGGIPPNFRKDCYAAPQRQLVEENSKNRLINQTSDTEDGFGRFKFFFWRWVKRLS